MHWNWRPPALLVAAVVLAYASAWPGAFQFDDFRVITGDPDALNLSQWLGAQPGMRSLLKLSFIANHALGGTPPIYLLTNLAIHLGATLLLWRLLLAWLPTLPDHSSQASAIALVAALIFAVHPAQTEAVTYLSGRSMSLMTLLGLLSVYLSLQRTSTPWRRILAALALVGALLVREAAIVVPLLTAVMMQSRGDRWNDIAFELRWQWLALLGAAMAFLGMPGYRQMLANVLLAGEPLQILRQQVDALSYLAFKALPAIEFSVAADGPRYASSVTRWWIHLTLLLLLASVAWRLRRREPVMAIGVLWMAVALLPYYSVLLRDDWVSVRHLYLAMPGFALLVGAVLMKLPQRIMAVVAAALCLALLARTAERNLDYKSELSLWSDTVRSSPASARAWNNLGYAQQQIGEPELAVTSYRRALAIDPEHVPATFNLQRALEEMP